MYSIIRDTRSLLDDFNRHLHSEDTQGLVKWLDALLQGDLSPDVEMPDGEPPLSYLLSVFRAESSPEQASALTRASAELLASTVARLSDTGSGRQGVVDRLSDLLTLFESLPAPDRTSAMLLDLFQSVGELGTSTDGRDIRRQILLALAISPPVSDPESAERIFDSQLTNPALAVAAFTGLRRLSLDSAIKKVPILLGVLSSADIPGHTALWGLLRDLEIEPDRAPLLREVIDTHPDVATLFFSILRDMHAQENFPRALTAMQPVERTSGPQYWTNASVLALAGDDDPVVKITGMARNLVLNAFDDGWTGPPFDPIKLAHMRRITLHPTANVSDARILVNDHVPIIEYNPNLSKNRMRFSLAHELAHTFFPDYHEMVRYRGEHTDSRGDDWQLELLCNVAAAEMTMPIGSLPDTAAFDLTIGGILKLQRQFRVSTEAILLRIAKLTDQPCSMFLASRLPAAGDDPRYRVDYTHPSRSWPYSLRRGLALPVSTVLRDCSALGETAIGDETWARDLPPLHVEAAAVSPYPGQSFPRVAGLLRPTERVKHSGTLFRVVRGDATRPRGKGLRIIAHVVSNRVARWGAGFGLAIARKWPQVQEEYLKWARLPLNVRLGATHLTEIDGSIAVFHMIAQSGFGPSPKPRIRYSQLYHCLDILAEVAVRQNATVHMPRIGSGQAGGNWQLIADMVKDAVSTQGVDVTVYVPPGEDTRAPAPRGFDFSS